MSLNTGGLEYEFKVYSTLKSVEGDLPRLEVLGDAPSGGFNAHDVDLQLSIDNIPYNIEIKSSPNDQMGGTSFRYDGSDFNPVNDIDNDTMNVLMEALENKKDAASEYINYVRGLEPQELHCKVAGFPLTITKKAREEAKKAGYLKNLNTTLKTSSSFIVKHYNKKNVNYIQMGEAGLFYMGDNPLDLPVPHLDDSVQIEVRLGFAGGKAKFMNEDIRSAGLRAQARMKTKSKSPHSLDNPESVRELFK